MFENQKDLHTNEPAYIIGSGPTVLKFYPDNHDDGIYIGVGEIFMIPEIRDKLDFLMTEKKHPSHKDLPDKITVFYTNWRNGGMTIDWEPNFILYKEHDLKEWDPSFMSMKVRSMIYHGFYLALHMGCAPIYLVGCDCTEGKFHPHKEKYQYKKMKLGWEKIKESHPHVEIININPVELADIFPSIYTDTEDREFLENNPASP